MFIPVRGHRAAMSLKLWLAECGDACAFKVWSHDRDEVAEHLKVHAQSAHALVMSPSEVKVHVRSAAEAKAARA
jgi:predicted small metal-binding protein